MDNKSPDISIILPVYNCYSAFKKGLPILKNIIFDLGGHNEIIVVNDGSEMEFDEINNLAILNKCRLISYKGNKGKGYAVKRGVLAALGKFVIYIDGDFPFDIKIIHEAYKKIRQPGVDMIIGTSV